MKPETISNRFLKYVNKQDNENCWLWTGADAKRYGKFWDGNKYEGAHRASYELFINKIPRNKLVLHKCDNPNCVNPKHLFLGNHHDNTVDAINKGRFNRIIRAKGEKNGRAILNESNVIEIINSRETTASLARKFNVNFMTVSCIRKNKSWKHIGR